jgi:hypothetical protein
MTSHPWETDQAAFTAQIKNFMAEGGGMQRAFLVRRKDIEQLALGGLLGNAVPMALSLALATAIKSIKAKQGTRDTVLCQLCDHAFVHDLPAAFFIWLPGGKTDSGLAHKSSVACGLCKRCARKNDRQLMSAMKTASKKLWPDSQALGVIDQ